MEGASREAQPAYYPPAFLACFISTGWVTVPKGAELNRAADLWFQSLLCYGKALTLWGYSDTLICKMPRTDPTLGCELRP